MSKHGKNYQKSASGVEKNKLMSSVSAIEKAKELSYAKFDESLDVSVNLGIDPLKGDQVVRGSVMLPHGSGKKTVVVVFAKGDYADQAKKAGADFVGSDDLIDKISKGWLDFNFAVATPDMMGSVGKLAKLLGPRGLLPNKKFGTVTFDVESIVTDLKKGRLFFKNDKSGLVHFSFGKLSFDSASLSENLNAFIKALFSAKPSSSKGKFLKKITVSSSMGVGLSVNPDSFSRI